MPTTHTSYGTRTTRTRKSARSNVITVHNTSSLVSVLSSLTQKSNGSSGSNSTVTQESITRGKGRRARSPQRETGRRSMPSSPKDVIRYGKPSSSSSSSSSSSMPSTPIAEEEPSSVLAYCEEDPEGVNEEYMQNMIKAKEEEALHRAEDESSRHHKYIEGPNAPQELEAYDPRRQQYHHDYPIGTIPELGVVKRSPSSLYDSGISIRSTSPERDSPVQQKTRKILAETQTKTVSKTSSKTSSKILSKSRGKKPARSRDIERKPRLPEAPMPPSRDPSPSAAFAQPSGRFAEAPGHNGYPYNQDPRLHPMQYSQRYAHQPMGYPPDQQSLLQHPDMSRSPSIASHASTSASGPSKASADPPSNLPAKAGYDLLVSKLSSHASAFSSDQTPPVYRKFEALQNYKLLHLQDEIAEAEVRFDRLNAYLGEGARLEGHKECSRRMDDQMVDQLHWERRQWQDFLFAKIEEYNKALTSYNTLSETLPRASPSQVASYKSMLSELLPPLYAPERAFIDAAESDLVAIATASSSSYSLSGPGGRMSPQATAAALLALLVAFKLVPHFLSRLVVGAVGGVALAGPDIVAVWGTDEWESGLKRVALHAVAVLVLACAVG